MIANTEPVSPDQWQAIQDELVECRRRDYDDESWERYIGGVMKRLYEAATPAPQGEEWPQGREVDGVWLWFNKDGRVVGGPA